MLQKGAQTIIDQLWYAGIQLNDTKPKYLSLLLQWNRQLQRREQTILEHRLDKNSHTLEWTSE